jgi:hypothetical protein
VNFKFKFQKLVEIIPEAQENIFYNISVDFHYFAINTSRIKVLTFIWIEEKKIEIPFTQGLCGQSLVEIG